MKRLFRGFARSGDGSGRRSRATDSRRALRTASSDTSPCSEATGRRGTARRNAQKPRSGVTSSTGWPSSVGHRRTLLVGDGPVSRVRCGPVPIHAPTPLVAHILQVGEFRTGAFGVILENSQCFKPGIRTECFEDVITEMPGFAGAIARQIHILVRRL